MGWLAVLSWGHAGAGHHCGGRGIEEEQERPRGVRRVDAADAQKFFPGLLEEVDGGGEGQRRLAALAGATEPGPVDVGELMGGDRAVPDGEGTAGVQGVAGRSACCRLLAEQRGEAVAGHAPAGPVSRAGRVQSVRSLLVATARVRPDGENPAARSSE